MSTRRGSLVAAILAAVLAVTPGLVAPTGAQAPAGSLPTRPTDAGLTAAAAATVSDAPHTPPTAEVDLAAIGAASAARVERMTTSEWSLAALADSFEGDPERAFAFVRDRIAFDAYPGILRGAEGTLAARAGNAWDRAILLRSLLETMALSTRFATADLDDTSAALVAARVLDPVAVPLEDGAAIVDAQLPVDAIGVRARRDYALLRGALGDRTGDMRSLTTADLVADTRQHAWVQVFRGTGWVDYDPTFADSAPGSPVAVASGTTTVIPDELLHRVMVRVVAGNLGPTGINEQSVLERPFVASEVADRQVFLYFQPESEGMGGGIVRSLTGIDSWTPVILVDGEAEAGRPFEAGGRGTDIFGDATEVRPLATLRIEVVRLVPGRPEVTATHVLLDRVPSDRVGATDLAPEELAPLAEDETGPLVLGVMEQVLVSTGGLSAWLQEARRGIAADFLDHTLSDEAGADERALGDLLYPLAVANASLVLGAERLSIPALGEPGRIRGYVAAPRVYLASLGQDPQTATALGFGTDLLLDDVRVVAADDAAADGALAALWYGTLQAALETEEALARAGGLGAATDDLAGTSLAMGEPLSIVTAAPGPGALADAVGSGAIVIVPGDPVTTSVWWTVDPASGLGRAVLDPGAGGIHGKPAWGSIRHRPPVIHRGGAGGANVWHVHPDGSIRRYPPGARPPAGNRPMGPPPSRCGGGQEYVILLGCVSIPAAWAIRIGVGLIVTAVVTNAIIAFLM